MSDKSRPYQFPFEKLEILQLAIKIRKILKTFPIEEKYGLIDQMRKSVSSVCSNRSEGYLGKRQMTKQDLLKWHTSH